MKIFIAKTMTKFILSVKNSNGGYLVKSSSVRKKIITVNKTSIFLTPSLATSIQS